MPCFFDQGRPERVIESLTAFGWPTEIAQMTTEYMAPCPPNSQVKLIQGSFTSECACTAEKRDRRFTYRTSKTSTVLNGLLRVIEPHEAVAMYPTRDDPCIDLIPWMENATVAIISYLYIDKEEDQFKRGRVHISSFSSTETRTLYRMIVTGTEETWIGKMTKEWFNPSKV